MEINGEKKDSGGAGGGGKNKGVGGWWGPFQGAERQCALLRSLWQGVLLLAKQWRGGVASSRRPTTNQDSLAPV